VATDMLARIRSELEQRMTVLRPLLDEYERLIAAADTLANMDADAPAPAGDAPAKRALPAQRNARRTPVERRGRGRRGSAAGALERAASGAKSGAATAATSDGPVGPSAPSAGTAGTATAATSDGPTPTAAPVTPASSRSTLVSGARWRSAPEPGAPTTRRHAAARRDTADTIKPLTSSSPSAPVEMPEPLETPEPLEPEPPVEEELDERPRKAVSQATAQQAILAALEHGSHTATELVMVTAMSSSDIRNNLSRLARRGGVMKVKRAGDGKSAYALASARVRLRGR
jgi:hypothetical protein